LFASCSDFAFGLPVIVEANFCNKLCVLGLLFKLSISASNSDSNSKSTSVSSIKNHSSLKTSPLSIKVSAKLGEVCAESCVPVSSATWSAVCAFSKSVNSKG